MGKLVADKERSRQQQRPTHRRRPSVLPADLLFEPPADRSDENALFPTEDALIPNENALTPLRDAVIPTEDALVPIGDALIPDQNALIPTEDALIPSQNVLIPTENGFIPTDIVLIPNENPLILGDLPDSNSSSDEDDGDSGDEEEKAILHRIADIYIKREMELLASRVEELQREILEMSEQLEKLKKQLGSNNP